MTPRSPRRRALGQDRHAGEHGGDCAGLQGRQTSDKASGSGQAPRVSIGAICKGVANVLTRNPSKLAKVSVGSIDRIRIGGMEFARITLRPPTLPPGAHWRPWSASKLPDPMQPCTGSSGYW